MSYFMFFQKFNIYIALWFPYYQELKRQIEREGERKRERKVSLSNFDWKSRTKETFGVCLVVDKFFQDFGWLL